MAAPRIDIGRCALRRSELHSLPGQGLDRAQEEHALKGSVLRSLWSGALSHVDHKARSDMAFRTAWSSNIYDQGHPLAEFPWAGRHVPHAARQYGDKLLVRTSGLPDCSFAASFTRLRYQALRFNDGKDGSR